MALRRRPAPDRANLREQLLDLLRSIDPELGDDAAAGTPLLSSGVLDSLAVVEVADWVAEAVGRPIPPTEVHLPDDWDDVDAIVTFVERARD